PSFFLAASPSSYTYTLSLHDALPIFAQDLDGLREEPDVHALVADERDLVVVGGHLLASPAVDHRHALGAEPARDRGGVDGGVPQDRKSTRLNSSHVKISYAVFCLKKK